MMLGIRLVDGCKYMMFSKLRMATLSSIDRVFSDVVLTIPLRAVTTSDPLKMVGMPAQSSAQLMKLQ